MALEQFVLRTTPVRLVAPALAAGRVVLSIVALLFVLEGMDLRLAATYIALGVVAGIVQTLPPWSDVDLDPGLQRFNDLADYLGLILVPWMLTRALATEMRGTVEEVVLDTILLVGAIRIARPKWLVPDGSDSLIQVGLGPEFFALAAVIAVFLQLPETLTPSRFVAVLLPFLVVMCAAMIAPLPYPRLTLIPGFRHLMVAVVAAMPFLQTEIIAALVGSVGLLFLIVGTFFLPEPIG